MFFEVVNNIKKRKGKKKMPLKQERGIPNKWIIFPSGKRGWLVQNLRQNGKNENKYERKLAVIFFLIINVIFFKQVIRKKVPIFLFG